MTDVINITDKTKITEMATIICSLQDKMNAMTNDDWVNAGFDWKLYGEVEAFEAIGHLPYKHWKSMTMDVEQVQLELVDMFHFFVSNLVVSYNGDLDEVSEFLSKILDPETSYDSGSKTICNSDDVVKRLIYIFRNYSTTLNHSAGWIEAMNLLGLNQHDFYVMYMTKNVLNQFRQKNGYKTGAYIKLWFGEEDNVHLSRILNETEFKGDITEFCDCIMAKLQDIYDDVVLEQVSEAS